MKSDTSNGSHLNYATIQQQSWERILSCNPFAWQPPLTVHLPIQPVHSPDFIHVDSAMNVCRRRVIPNLSTSDRGAYQQAREQMTFILQFALDDPPFVPDFRSTTLRLAEGKYPVATADYFAWDLLYEFEYFCSPLHEGQSLLGVRGSITNEGEQSRSAHVRAKVNFQRECDLFDYHYVPFYWDAAKWLSCDTVRLKDHQICHNERVIGKIVPDEFSVRWEDQAQFQDNDYNERFGCGEPYFVTPALRLKAVDHVVHFQTTLAPGEKKSYFIAMLTNTEDIQEEDLTRLANSAPDVARASALDHFRSQCSDRNTGLAFPKDRWEDLFTELQLSILQLLVKSPGGDTLMPTQGGSTERYFVWVWEAVHMLMPMLRLGHFGPVRRALDFIFALQDAGCPPEGQFTTIAGAIGTTGPKWMNSTGSALALAADYYQYAKDEEFLAEYLPKILKAAGWIVGELRATRKLNADGSRPPWFGLMPFGCATDGDIGYIVAFTDAFTFWGLEKTVRLLELVGHEQADVYRRELETYRSDIDQAVGLMTRPDGYIERKIATDQSSITNKFENACSALQMAFTGNLDIHSEAFARFLAYFEEKLMDGPFAGRMDREICYMGTGEYVWHHTYLRRGEWKKAFLALQANLRYGMTQDTFQVQERFSKRNPAFTPWQPNGSGNGRMLDMVLNSLYFEHDHGVTLLGGVPFAWLRENATTALHRLYTPRGRISLEAVMVDSDHCQVVLRALDRGSLPLTLRFPDHFQITAVSAGYVDTGNGFFASRGEAVEAKFTIVEQ